MHSVVFICSGKCCRSLKVFLQNSQISKNLFMHFLHFLNCESIYASRFLLGIKVCLLTLEKFYN